MKRREFIKKTGCALSLGAVATQFRHLGLMDALAQTGGGMPGPYRALVCIFLKGGNDGNNTLIPAHEDKSVSNYADYSAARQPQGLAIRQSSLLRLEVPRLGKLVYGLHPALGAVDGGLNAGIHELWGQGKLAIATNVGCLAAPLTREEYLNRTAPIPDQLFSHSNQIAQTQAGRADQTVFSGWGGRTADRMTHSSNPAGLVPMVTSIKDVQLFSSGASTLPMTIKDSSRGLDQVLALHGFTGTTEAQARLRALNEIRSQELDQEYIAAASHIADQAVQASQALSGYEEVSVDFPNTEIGRQLKQVARLVKKRTELNVTRQIFFCQVDGFDSHNNQLGAQENLLGDFSQAARAFYDELVVQGISGDVTTFTMSDFGRTLNPAGSGGSVGSDHGWANHLFVFGDSVIGGDFYGLDTTNGTPFPTLALSGPDDSDSGAGARGRWIPTTAVEQYAATLARWYGLAEEDMTTVFPNLNVFSGSDLGFMN